MAAYAVFEPPPRRRETAAHTDRFVFVRDGFGWGAFLLGPVWMLWRGLWLVLLGYIVAIAVLEVGFRWMGVPAGSRMLVGMLIALLVGFEAATLRRWTLVRHGWRDLGIVVAADVEAAERRFFEAWVAGEALHPLARPSVPAPPRRTSGAASARPASEVIGLFPEPGASR